MRVRLRLVTRHSKPSAPPFHYGCGYQLVVLHPSFRFRIKVWTVTMDDPIDVLQYAVQYQSQDTLLLRTCPPNGNDGPWKVHSLYS